MKKIFIFCTALMIIGKYFPVQANTFATQVCYGRVCQPMSFSSKEGITQELNNLFSSHIQEILFCEANPATRTCQHDGLQFSGQTAHIGMEMALPFARLLHVENTPQGLEVALDYQIQANGAYPICTVSTGKISFYKGIMQLSTNDFSCQLTQYGSTKVSISFQLDFVDFEKKCLGAYYTIFSQGEANLNGSGYALLRLTKNTHSVEQRSVTYDPWKMGAQAPVVRTQSGMVGMGSMNEAVLMNQKTIQKNQQTWGIPPQQSTANGLGGWYLNERGAYVPMAAADTSWKSKLETWWEKLKKIIYLEPLE